MSGQEDKAETGVPGTPLMTKGRRLWHVLQKGYRHAKQKMGKEDMKVLHLSHGLQHLANISLLHPVRHITYDALKKIYVVLDLANMLHFLREDGSYKSCHRAPVPMVGLLYASEVDQFVAWTEGGLQVLDSSFHVLSQVLASLPIRCTLYSELLNRVVTAGDGNVTIWEFRYGSRSLQPRLVLTEGLAPSDVFSRLTLDASGVIPQRCFASCGTGVAVFNISSGKLLSFKKDLHSREITDIDYCEAVRCVVTASRDTTIKVWDENWSIQTVFVGHTGPATAVTIYPQRPLIFSASLDGTIRTWNLDIVDQVDQVHLSEPAEILEAKTTSRVFSTSGLSLNMWKINKLYSLHTHLGVPVQHLSCTNMEAVGPFPIRVLCVCQDSSVRLLDVASGEVLSTLCLEKHSRIVSEAYCLPRETVFVLTAEGTFLRINAASDPMVVRKSKPSYVQGSLACCLLLYSHLVEPQRAYLMWQEVLESKGEKKQWQKLPLNLQDRNRYILIMGHRNGLLSTMEWFSGRTEYTVEAHGTGQVTALSEYPTQTCIISAGADHTVKMWRLFPYARECLVPLLCFSCATPAVHMCPLGETLAVAFQDPETVTYSIVYYNLMEQTRTEHGPEDDPLDDITGLCCCPHMKLFASASRDGSVKIWDIQNQLLRHLKLNTIPESLAFANHKGDLLVGIERHLYIIHHNKYLPSYYKMKLLCAKFLEPIEDIPLPISDACFEQLVQDNLWRLMNEPPLEEPGSPVPEAPQVVPQVDSKEIRETKSKEEELAQLEMHAQDLQQLQKGKVRTVKKRLSFSKEIREEAFERYLRIFYREQPHVEIPEEDTFNADEVLEQMRLVDSISDLYGPQSQFLGEFPQPVSLKTFSWALQDASSSADQSPQSPAARPPPRRPGVRPPPQVTYKSRKGSLEKVELEPPPKERRMTPLKLPLPPTDTLIFISTDMDEAVISSPVLRRSPRTRRTLQQLTADLGMVKLSWEKATAAALARQADPDYRWSPPISPKPASLISSTIAEESVESVESDDQVPALVLEEQLAAQLAGTSPGQSPPRVSLEVPSIVPGSQESLKEPCSPLLSDLVPQQPEGSPDALRISTGFIPNSVVVQKLPGQRSARSKASSRSTSRPTSKRSARKKVDTDEGLGREVSGEELTGIMVGAPRIFLTQLDETLYAAERREIPFFVLPFKDKDWFKALFPEGYPDGMSLNQFLMLLLDFLIIADLNTKITILGAIMSLQEEMWGEMPKLVCATLIIVLQSREEALSIQDRSQKRFILTALRALLRLDPDSHLLMVELMTNYLQAPESTRAIIKSLIKEVGVEDPHNYFYQEMDSWHVEADATQQFIREVCNQWLEGVTEELQEHRRRAWEQKFLPEKKESLEDSQKEFKDLEDAEEPPESEPSESEPSESQSASVTELEDEEEKEAVETSDHLMDFQNVRPVDAIHYFIQKQLERELEAMRQLISSPRPAEAPKDTILALPAAKKGRAILRIGETNAMMRKRASPEHITGFCHPFPFARYVMKGFAPFVKLPLPKITLDPFPPDSEKMVQMVQKYFIPKASFAQSYP